MKKVLFLVATFFSVFCFADIALASQTELIQPAAPAEAITYNEDLTVNGTGRFDSIYIGKQGVGGVTFFNGTIVNSTTDNGADNPVTFGDGVRIDGAIWRGPSKGTGDGQALKIADSIYPALSGANDFGSAEFLWNNGFFSGDVSVGNIIGSNVVGEDNIVNSSISNSKISNNAVNSAKIKNGTIQGGDLVANYRTGSAYDSRFVNVDGDTMSGKLTISGASGVLNQMLEVSNSSTSGRGIYSLTTGSSSRAVYGRASSTSGTNYGGYFEALGASGKGIYGVASGAGGYGVHGYASSSGYGVYGSGGSSGTGVYGITYGTSDYGVHGVSSGSTGRGVYGIASSTSTSSHYGGYFEALGTNGVGVQGVVGGSGARGVYGYSGNASGGYGVYGYALGNSNSYSGYFAGSNFKVDINGYDFEISGLNSGTGTSVVIDSGGNLLKTTSSERYKENIKPLSVNTANVLDLQSVSFRYIELKQEDVGLIAEEVDKVIPDLVVYDKNNNPESVKYDRVSIYLLEVIKEQQGKIESQENDIENLKSALCEEFPEKEICR